MQVILKNMVSIISFKNSFFSLFCYFKLFLIALAFFADSTNAQFEDLRCKCTCLSFPKYDIPAQIYTGGVISSDCDCLNVVVPVLNGSLMQKSDLEPYCLRCSCKYEVRSTKTMQVVVCIFIILITMLLFYMTFILAVDPIMTYMKKKKKASHRDGLFEMSSSQSTSSPEHRGSKSLFETVNLVQSRWKKQVQEQRTNVFEKQDMLQ